MAKTVKKDTSNSDLPSEKLPWKIQRQYKVIFGFLLVLISIGLTVAFISWFKYGPQDQSNLNQFPNLKSESGNWAGEFGSYVSEFFIRNGFGVASFLFIKIFFLIGLYLILDLPLKKLRNSWFWDLYIIVLTSITLGFFADAIPDLGGTIGFEINDFFRVLIGKIGTVLLIVFGVLIYLFFKIKVSPDGIKTFFENRKQQMSEDMAEMQSIQDDATAYNLEEYAVDDQPEMEEKKQEEEPFIMPSSQFEVNKEALKPTISSYSDIELEPSLKTEPNELDIEAPEVFPSHDEVFVIEKALEEDVLEENLASKLVADFGLFDPTLELSNYKFPTIDLLKEYASVGITINQAELEENKNNILETLRNYKIEIAQIKATVGPSVTLYEIVPEAGIRISKIKSLEDDIALSLAALGIRIIAPIPGKGTIGIEVPNKNPTMVPMKTVISSAKFQEAEMELPIALGKTISNETFVFDLAKMPHLLMAGATGQGKSVGLNAVLTSLLYKKHPAEVKFVLVDPKKVELFKERKLNPENGHRFLPYIVLVVDEFADLIMTAGKEVETPIARLAQLARAIGIHLIIATQRPSVNVITGMIKANFPARIAFRVTSKIDSRTILDSGGADQLIGRGDLLFSNGNDLVRVQCAFVDTPEVEKIVDFIGAQKAYATAYQLPEYLGEEGNIKLDFDISERDPMFREAAEIIVTAQQGSASLLQRKLKLGYNRAGRLIDQLEAAGIVGPFEGSKARNVNISDLVALEQFFNDEQNNEY